MRAVAHEGRHEEGPTSAITPQEREMKRGGEGRDSLATAMTTAQFLL